MIHASRTVLSNHSSQSPRTPNTRSVGPRSVPEANAEFHTSGDRLLNDKEAAQKLGVTPATLRSWRCRGIGPSFVKMGLGKKSPVRYSVADIGAFVDQCRQVPLVRAALEN